MEKILKITEIDFTIDEYYKLSGYIIETDKQEIKFGISNNLNDRSKTYGTKKLKFTYEK